MDRTARIPRTLDEAWGGRWPQPLPISGPFRRESNGRIRGVLLALVIGVGLGAALAHAI